MNISEHESAKLQSKILEGKRSLATKRIEGVQMSARSAKGKNQANDVSSINRE